MYEIFEQLLQERGLSVYRVSKDTGIAQSTFSSWKAHKNKLSTEKASILAKYFDVSIDFLMGSESKKLNDVYELNKARLSVIINEHPENTLKILSMLCKKSRIEKDMTEKSVANATEIDLNEYLAFENECKNIGIDNITKLLVYFNVNIEFTAGYLTGILIEPQEKTIEKLLFDNDFKRDFINDLKIMKEKYENGEIIDTKADIGNVSELIDALMVELGRYNK